MERLNWVSSIDPRLASASACAFSARGTCWMVKVGNAFNSSWTLSRPAGNASYSTSLLEAGKPSVIAYSNRVPSGVVMTTPAPAPIWPASNASYSAGLVMTTPALAPFWFDAPSTRNCHMCLSWLGSAEVSSAFELSFFLSTSFSSSADGVNSATKSAKAGLLLQFLAGKGGHTSLAL
ncbi:hypothetical protein L3X38_025188 [Prunus dulcis]|uniref:Uncharacterized protein n=1 Tax=Prunus dulcis TaxID=3755 RepID=A0AAD4W175_PRUDU|nr:hypothetical protein L3X38_025188 [Prunus dulcis]